MVGRRNTEGTRLTCSHCKYTWLYQSNREKTSCPRCGWLVRVYVPSAGSGRQPVDSFNKTDQLF